MLVYILEMRQIPLTKITVNQISHEFRALNLSYLSKALLLSLSTILQLKASNPRNLNSGWTDQNILITLTFKSWNSKPVLGSGLLSNWKKVNVIWLLACVVCQYSIIAGLLLVSEGNMIWLLTTGQYCNLHLHSSYVYSFTLGCTL